MEEAYFFLLEPTTKNHIIKILTDDIEERYKLDKKYISILDNLYKPYKRTQKQTKTITRTESQTKTIKQEKQKTGTGAYLFAGIIAILIEAIKIIGYVFIVPLVFIISFFIHKK